ncbi:uncharacterized protein LOC127140919 isoform X4 [Lates calcarifer]|uniref:Uncharacterized protein LOC127140919 isoform X4 n=1 Tax=Lates calcarifer TaxID=8187 RepID=A0AAJ8DN35_LATCA|nr:uncharacterized protein LOC127140919 isoform X4 [Lates calcarifer]
MPLKRKKENPETQSSAPSEESSPMNSQESPCQGLSQASNEESSLMDENKADPSPTQESSNEEQRYQLHLNTMDQQQPTSIPEELRALFPPDLLKAAYSLVEDYRRMDPFNTNLREFFNLLTEFTIKIKKKKDSHTRTPGRVKVFSLVTGQTCGADEAILKKVKNYRGSPWRRPITGTMTNMQSRKYTES